MAQSTLALAKSTFEEANRLLEESASAGENKDALKSLSQSKMVDGLNAASEALVEFRRAGDAEGRIAALEIVVQCDLALNDMLAAVVAAGDELAMFKKAGDKKAAAKAMDVLQSVQSARGDPAGALATAEEWLAAQKELGDRAGEAKALKAVAGLKLDVGRKNEAMTLATESVRIYRELGLAEGEAAAERVVSRVCTSRGVVDKAPNRQEARDALQDLAAAVESRDQEGWNAALKVLNQTCAYSQKEVDDVMARALEQDPAGARKFLDEQGIGPSQKAATGECQLSEVYKKDMYIKYRAGGLQYGPRFRCLQGYKFAPKGGEEAVGAFAVLQISEEAQDWERELAFNPGILDGLLQSTACIDWDTK